MKKIFAIFCSICLMPAFSAQAWIGGPFSNNSHFGQNGDDGVYEATASTINGIALFRFSVGNNFDGVNPQGVNSSVPTQTSVNPGPLITVPGIASGNVVIGALANQWTNVWYYEGVQYFGTTLGTVSSASNYVIGMATSSDNGGAGANSISSAFQAKLSGRSKLIPVTAFQGVGQAQTSGGTQFSFTVLGSKVSSRLTYGL